MRLISSLRSAQSAFGLVKIPLSMFRPFNVCMWHAGRCGSTVIADLLNQDGRIVWGGEILEGYTSKGAESKHRQASWKGAKQRILFQQLKAGAKIFGFELKCWHLKKIGVNSDQAYHFLRRQNYNKHILLERKNHLRVLVSTQIARTTSKFHIRVGKSPVSTKINLQKDAFKRLQNFEKYFGEIKRPLPENCLKLTFENDILPDPKLAYWKIADFLNLEPRGVVVNYQRTCPEELSDLLINYEEISNNLKGTKYEWMLTAS